MKTRQEMIYDFMISLASNSKIVCPCRGDDELSPSLYEATAGDVYSLASAFVTEFLENAQ
jgi:hypothetical protein